MEENQSPYFRVRINPLLKMQCMVFSMNDREKGGKCEPGDSVSEMAGERGHEATH